MISTIRPSPKRPVARNGWPWRSAIATRQSLHAMPVHRNWGKCRPRWISACRADARRHHPLGHSFARAVRDTARCDRGRARTAGSRAVSDPAPQIQVGFCKRSAKLGADAMPCALRIRHRAGAGVSRPQGPRQDPSRPHRPARYAGPDRVKPCLIASSDSGRGSSAPATARTCSSCST